ncbi:FAD:protein FMN transferase [Paenibacillus sp. yr247]|uniref:FAD:protein FMN transferase n=1 Tax=Paenibacillus sp. yr247 TaxID=1761880 RepID=UPI0011405BA8|nr:FAD:protein FMN transferase [Paenibacillus sp. yr247]
MNTQIQVLLASEYEISRFETEIISHFKSAEERFSRFLPTSECSRLNQQAGSRCMVSKEMAAVLELSRHYFEITEGVFNISILPALERYGYQRTFETLSNGDVSVEVSTDPISSTQMDCLQMDLDTAMQSVQMTAKQQMDLGGIVKSWTVQGLAASLRREWHVQSGIVNAGGDVEVWGGASDEEPWVIAIANPHRTEPSDEVLLLMVDGAVATSNTQRRSWETSEGRMHHLIDPRTMKPSSSSVIQCSVVGDHLVDCEIWAKVVCILGIEEGLSLFRRSTQRMEALIYTEDGSLHHVKPTTNVSFGQWMGLEADFIYDSNEKGG